MVFSYFFSGRLPTNNKCKQVALAPEEASLKKISNIEL